MQLNIDLTLTLSVILYFDSEQQEQLASAEVTEQSGDVEATNSAKWVLN